MADVSSLADLCRLRPHHAARDWRGEAGGHRAHDDPGAAGDRGRRAPRCCGAPCRTRRCRAASGRWPSTSTASRRAIAATSACPCFRCGTSPHGTCTSAANGPIRRPEDLAGRRIGMYSYTASGSIWYRHFLRFLGLDPAAIQWWIGDIDTPWSAPMDLTLPPGVKAPPPGRSLADMLIAGELEAIYSPPRPAGLSPRERPHRPTLPGLPRPRAGVLPQDRRLSSAAPDRPPTRGVGGRPVDCAEPHRRRSSPATTASPPRRRAFPTPRRGWRRSSRDTAAVMGEDFHPYGSSGTGRRSRCSRARRFGWASPAGGSRSRSTSRTSSRPEGGGAP